MHPRESDVHTVHPPFYTLHARDLVEFCHALQTGVCPKNCTVQEAWINLLCNSIGVLLVSILEGLLVLMESLC